MMRERLAEYAHDAWSGWMKYLFKISKSNENGSVTIPEWAVKRWTRQMNTPFEQLPHSEKISDFQEADKMIYITKSKIKASQCQFCGEPLKKMGRFKSDDYDPKKLKYVQQPVCLCDEFVNQKGRPNDLVRAANIKRLLNRDMRGTGK